MYNSGKGDFITRKIWISVLSVVLACVLFSYAAFAAEEYIEVGYSSGSPTISVQYNGVPLPSGGFTISQADIDYYSDTVQHFGDFVHFVKLYQIYNNLNTYSGLLQFTVGQSLDPLPAFTVPGEDFVRLGFAVYCPQLTDSNVSGSKILITNGLGEDVLQYTAWSLTPLIVGNIHRGYMIDYYVPTDSYISVIDPDEVNQAYRLTFTLQSTMQWDDLTAVTFEFSTLRVQILSATDVVIDAINNNTQLIIDSNDANAEKITSAIDDLKDALVGDYDNPELSQAQADQDRVASELDEIADGLKVDVPDYNPGTIVVDDTAKSTISDVILLFWDQQWLQTILLTCIGLWVGKILLYGTGG